MIRDSKARAFMSTRYGQCCIVLLAVSASLATASALLALEKKTTRTTVFRDEFCGISIRVPPSMTVLTGEEVREDARFGPRPDLEVLLNDPILEELGIGRASVIAYAEGGQVCPPTSPDPGWDPKTLDGRDVYHHTWWDAAGAFRVHTEGFSLRYRGKCFLVEVLIESMRIEDETPQDSKRRVARRDKIEAHLLDVIRTIKFLDPREKTP